MALSQNVRKLERADQLDPLTDSLAGVVARALPAGPVRSALRGEWLGHPLHPALVVVPLGSWISAAVLDWLPSGSRAARTLVGFGALAAVPTALAGLADWSTLDRPQQRTGVVHGAANAATLGLQLASYVDRRRGRPVRARALSLLGLGIGGAAAYLGGHLAYRQAANVDLAGAATLGAME